MTDITNVYNATLKAMRMRHPNTNPGRILKPPRKKDTFHLNAQRLLVQISNMKDLLQENRSAYVNILSHFSLGVKTMEDGERDDIDTQCAAFVSDCTKSISIFSNLSNKDKAGVQMTSHRTEVYALLSHYLKLVSHLYSEQKALRSKRSAQLKNLSSLLPTKRIRDINNSTGNHLNTVKSQTIKNDLHGNFHLETYHPDTSSNPEHLQMIQQENVVLMKNINNVFQDVQQVEQKVYDIAKMQQLISQNIMQQEECVNKIADQAVGASEDIITGNDEIVKALKKKASLRIWILFFLLLCSFSLIFLDWYNP